MLPKANCINNPFWVSLHLWFASADCANDAKSVYLRKLVPARTNEWVLHVVELLRNSKAREGHPTLLAWAPPGRIIRDGEFPVKPNSGQEMFFTPVGFLHFWVVNLDGYMTSLFLVLLGHSLDQSKGFMLATSNATSKFLSLWSWRKEGLRKETNMGLKKRAVKNPKNYIN